MCIASPKRSVIGAVAVGLCLWANAGAIAQPLPPGSFQVSVTPRGLVGIGSASATGAVPQRVYGDWSGVYDPDDDQHAYSLQGSAETFGGLRPMAAVQAEVSQGDTLYFYAESIATVEYVVRLRPLGPPPPGNYAVPALVNVRGEASGEASSWVRVGSLPPVSVATGAGGGSFASYDTNLRCDFYGVDAVEVRLRASANGYSPHAVGRAQSSQAYADPLFMFDQARFDQQQGANTFPLADFFEFEYSAYLLNPPGLPEIVTHPEGRSLCEGDGVVFDVAATSDAPMTYQWQLNGGALGDGDGISGAATPVLTIDPALWYFSGTIDCVVTNVAGSVTTNGAVLTVGTPATITYPPQGVTVAAGQPVAMWVYTAGSEPLQYQWRRNGVDLVDDGRVTGATTAGLAIDPAVVGDAGLIDVVVSNGCGSATSEAATLEVIGCAADFNGDGFLDFFDYDEFVACYEGVVCPPGATADFNGDGFVDFFDYDGFVGMFEGGC